MWHRAITRIDAYVVASRQEGGPKAVLESMACGVPLVTTRVGQAIDLVQHGVNGWMSAPEDANHLAAGLWRSTMIRARWETHCAQWTPHGRSATRTNGRRRSGAGSSTGSWSPTPGKVRAMTGRTVAGYGTEDAMSQQPQTRRQVRKVEHGRLAYYLEPATAEFWDHHWSGALDRGSYAEAEAGQLAWFEEPFTRYLPRIGDDPRGRMRHRPVCGCAAQAWVQCGRC